MNFSQMMTYFEMNNLVVDRTVISNLPDVNGILTYIYYVNVKHPKFRSDYASILYKARGHNNTRLALIHADIYNRTSDAATLTKGNAKCWDLEYRFLS